MSAKLAAAIQPILFLVFSAAVILLAVQDHLKNQLSDCIVIPLGVCGVTTNMFDLVVAFEAALLGASIGFCGIQALRIWQIRHQGSTGIGFGDAKFLGALGAWLGYPSIPAMLVGASLLMMTVYLRREEKPFGVGLGISALGLYGLRLID